MAKQRNCDIQIGINPARPQPGERKREWERQREREKKQKWGKQNLGFNSRLHRGLLFHRKVVCERCWRFSGEKCVVENWFPKLSHDDPRMIPKWSQDDPKMIPRWSQDDPKMIPKLHQSHDLLGPRWSQMITSANEFSLLMNSHDFQSRIHWDFCSSIIMTCAHELLKTLAA